MMDYFFYRVIYKATCMYMAQVGFRLNSSFFGVDYTVRCNQRIRSCLLFRRIDSSLLDTSGKY